MLVGLDLGTSGVKALLVDEAGTPIGSANASLDVAHPHAGWSEQNPADWLDACRATLIQLVADYPSEMKLLQGIGLSGQMHGATLLDADGQVLRPCILWNDTRAHAAAAKLDATGGVREASGNIVFPGFTAPKLVWVAENEPEVFQNTAKVLLPKDYVTFWLTGIYATDMSDAAGTSWLDVAARDWSDDLLAASGMRRDQMPTLFEGSDVIGQVREDLAADLGLPNGVAVVAGGADNAVAACGVGAMGEGDGFVSLGTSGVVLAARDGCYPAPETAVHTFCHAVPERWYQMGVMLAATDSLNWFARIVGDDAATLTDALGDDLQTPSALKFLPYLSGERTPHNDSTIRGGFVGLDIAHTRDDMTRAVLEGVCFGLRDSLEALQATGAKLDRLLAIGGGTGSRYWLELLATVLNKPLEIPAKGEFGAALGAARLAICGVTKTPVENVMRKPEIAEVIQPRADLIQSFEDAYRAFTDCYSNLKEMSK